MLNPDKIDRKIEELKREISSLEEKKIESLKKLTSMSTEHIVAEALHGAFCKHNHTDGCGWYYDDGTWSQYSRKEYLEKAEVLLRYYNKDQIFHILKIFKEAGVLHFKDDLL